MSDIIIKCSSCSNHLVMDEVAAGDGQSLTTTQVDTLGGEEGKRL